ncbi:MAG: bifunctional indole-3-glycerol-phosphate synthase TrpC/phosphoribosylanthranilate isomerase TrpF, partial [Neisseriaceae bacterium]|nr:bifunctional indole-3-glycerol-phosphate synthase TrpC/phosphoribosylanthranilate isomerase TrpF [Neisseriaceae bacterium]
MQKTVLNRIIEDKQAWIAARKYTQPLDSFQSMTRQSDRDFYGDLAAAQANGTAYILECKKASPSKGVLRPDFNPKAIASVYKDYATAISVLTDDHYFQGSFEFIPVVRAVASQPILCKDFIIDPYQIYLARHYHADAILLMLSVLCDQEYRELAAVAVTLNMGILTEVSNEAEMHRAVKLGAKVIGINNRNLRDMSIDLNHTRSLSKFAPEGTIIISESGINHHEDIRDLRQYAHGFLIGSSLMSVTNLDFAVRRLLLGENKVCGLTRPIDASIAYESGAVYGGLIFVMDSKRGVTLATA